MDTKNRIRNSNSIPRPEAPLYSFSRIMVTYLPFFGYQSDITLMADTQAGAEGCRGTFLDQNGGSFRIWMRSGDPLMPERSKASAILGLRSARKTERRMICGGIARAGGLVG